MAQHNPGISTGTPSGVGLGLRPPRYLIPGDLVELGIDGLGSSRQRLVSYEECASAKSSKSVSVRQEELRGCELRVESQKIPGWNWLRRAAVRGYGLESLLHESRYSKMKALVLQKAGKASIETFADPVLTPGHVLLRVRMVGFCGSNLNSFRGLNPLVSYPRVIGHEVSATVLESVDNRFCVGRTWQCRRIQIVEGAADR